MRIANLVLMEFESHREYRDFSQWVKLNLGKAKGQHLDLTQEACKSLTTHGAKMMRQYAALVEVSSD